MFEKVITPRIFMGILIASFLLSMVVLYLTAVIYGLTIKSMELPTVQTTPTTFCSSGAENDWTVKLDEPMKIDEIGEK